MFEPLHAARIALIEAASLALLNEFNAGNPMPADELRLSVKKDDGVWLCENQYFAAGVHVASEAF